MDMPTAGNPTARGRVSTEASEWLDQQAAQRSLTRSGFVSYVLMSAYRQHYEVLGDVAEVEVAEVEVADPVVDAPRAVTYDPTARSVVPVEPRPFGGSFPKKKGA